VSEETTEQTGIGFGLLGLGHHGTRYARHLAADVPGVTLRAACRRDPREGRPLAESLGARYYEDYTELLDDPQVEAVVICSPTSCHRDMAVAAAERGKSILLEKPIAATRAEADEILENVRLHGARLMVAQTLRYEPLAEGFRNAQPLVGRVRTLNLQHRSRDIRVSAGQPERPSEYRGVLLDTGVHYFDLLGWMFPGRLDTAWCEVRRHERTQSEDAFVAVLSGSDLQATIDVCRATPARYETWTAAGENGTLVGDRFAHTLKFLTPDGEQTLPLPEPRPTLPKVIRSFVRSLISGEPFDVPGEPARDAVAMVDACRKSAESGAPVML